jgi:G patch domain and KOW motifs-containing protein
MSINSGNTVTIDETSGLNSATTNSTNTNQQHQPILHWKTKKRPRVREHNNIISINNKVLLSEFSIEEKNGDIRQDDSEIPTGPLIIPVAPDLNQWKSRRNRPNYIVPSTEQQQEQKPEHNQEDLAAIQSLQDDATSNQLDPVISNSHPITTIQSRANTFVSGNTMTAREVQQYQHDLQSLPAALDETADEYQRIPVTEFGAALLRGMGWKGNDENGTPTNQRSTNEDVIPRPHRLGLGAIPAMLPEPTEMDSKASLNNGHRRPRNIDQYQRDQQKQKQRETYRMEREKKLAEDIQRTMQNGSIIHLFNKERARILKLVGVPGLNMVQIQFEGASESSIIKRNEIERLVTREELDEHPFREAARTISEIETSTHRKRNKDGKSDTPNILEHESNRDDYYDRNGRQLKGDGKEKKHSRKEDTTLNGSSWVIPNIRIRVITEKLGRKYYKEKGIVVDVTRNAGVTIKLSNGKSNDCTALILDRIPERYLETALPKIGGNVIVVNVNHSNKYCKGRLLERNTRNGIVQLYDDMDCITIPLDDIAEWCGPLDDDNDENF